MFDSSTYVKTVIHQNFQQVSGSLLKTHPDSTFIRFDRNSNMEDYVFGSDPRMRVRINSYQEPEFRPITVLQVLLAHNSSYICEVVVHYQKGDPKYKEEESTNGTI